MRKGFTGESVELDAMPNTALLDLIESAIRKHVDRKALRITELSEDSEQAWLQQLSTMSPPQAVLNPHAIPLIFNSSSILFFNERCLSRCGADLDKVFHS